MKQRRTAVAGSELYLSHFLVKMLEADSVSNPSRLLLQMLEAGWISRAVFDELHSLTGDERRLAFHMHGNVSVFGFNLDANLRPVAQVFNTAELLE